MTVYAVTSVTTAVNAIMDIKYIEYKRVAGELCKIITYIDGTVEEVSGYSAPSVKVYEYPRYNPNKAEEYVTGLLWDGEGSVGVLHREQNGFKYSPDGKKIIGKGKHVKQKEPEKPIEQEELTNV